MPSPVPSRLRVALLLPVMALVSGNVDLPFAAAQSPASAGEGAGEAANVTARNRDSAARWHGEFADYEVRVGDGATKPILLPTPLLSWSNPDNFDITGATYLWTHSGRPCVIANGFVYDIRDSRRTKHAFHSLSATPVALSSRKQLVWQVDKPGITWQTMPAPGGAASIAQGQLSLRRAARKFALEMISHRDEKTTLRLMPTPLYRYRSAEQGVSQGAIFAFANGNDPDAFVLLERRESTPGEVHFSFARSHYYRLEARLDHKSVWVADLDIGQQRAYLQGTELPIRSNYVSLIVREMAAPPKRDTPGSGVLRRSGVR